MAGPPKDVPASELFQKLMERPRPSEVVDFPRYNEDGTPIARVRLRVLTGSEQARAQAQTWKGLKETHKLSDHELDAEVMKEGMYGNWVASELLALACQSERNHRAEGDPGPPLYTMQFANGAQVRDQLTPDEIGTLFTLYMMVQQKFGPYARDIRTEEEFTAWVKRLVEGGSQYPLASRNSSQLIEFASMSAVRVYALSRILDSLTEHLPKSLGYQLRTWGIGVGCFSALPETTTEASTSVGSDGPGSGIETNLDPDMPIILAPDSEPIDLDMALTVAKALSELS